MTRRVASIVLAAGASTRMGRPKQLIEVDGEPLVRRAAHAALEAGTSPVIVVLGANAELISRELEILRNEIRVIVNDDWLTGLASSIRAGINAITEDECDGILITLADQSLIGARALEKLLDAFDVDRRIVASAYDDVIGVPAVFGIEYRTELMMLSGDAGAGSWLRRRERDVTKIPMPEATGDTDTPADLANLDKPGQSSRL